MEPQAFLVRVYADTSTVGYYSPLINGCPALLPIPEPRLRLGEAPPWLDPRLVAEPCTGRPLAWFMPVGGEWVLHRDPRLDLGFYTEPLGPRGRLPQRRIGRGWLLVFAAGLAVYPEGFWSARRRRGEILAAFRAARRAGLAGVYAVAALRVERVLRVTDWGDPVLPGWLRESPHAAVGEPVLAVVGEPVAPEEPVPLEPWRAPGQLRPRLERLYRGRLRAGPLGPAGEVEEALGV